MKQQLKTLMYGAILAMPCSAFAQAFSENMGSAPATAAIAAHDGAATGFQNSAAFAFTGTGDVRNTDASVTGVNGYSLASGGGNVFISNTPAGKSFQIANINTTGLVSPSLSFGIRKTTNANDGSELVLEASTDGINFTALSYPVLPVGASGFAHWYYRTATTAVPSGTNVTIRWRNTNTSGLTTQYRIDDVMLSGGAPVPTCTASIFVSGSANCGGTAILTAVSSITASGNTYVWSPGGATTSTISTTTGGSFSVTITGTNGCVSSAQAGVSSTPVPTLVVVPSPASSCGGSVALCAHPIAGDLLISEYSEGEGGFEKYIEIFNGTNAVATLTNYVYQAYHNGAVVPTFTVNLATFQPTLGAGDVLVLRNPGSTVAIAGSYTTNTVDFNGNDALAIYNLSTSSFADIFGTIGQNPGAAWTGTSPYSTADRTLRRKTDVYAGVNINPAGGFPTLVSEWDVFFASDLSGFGAHTLSASSYAWSNGGNSSCIAITPTASSVYTVTGTFSVSGCSATETVQVNVTEGLSVVIDVNTPTITTCYGDQCSGIQAIVLSGAAPFTYTWSNGDNAAFTTVCPTVTTVYSLTTADANGCSNTATASIEVINACCNGNDVIVCNGTETLCVDSAEVNTYIMGGATVGPCVDGGRKAAPSALKSPVKNNMPVLNAYPNPFADVTAVEIKLTENNKVKIEIMDYTGKKVAELNNSVLAAGTHTFNWNGNNQAGNSVAGGIYLCRITSGDNVQNIKIQKLSK